MDEQLDWYTPDILARRGRFPRLLGLVTKPSERWCEAYRACLTHTPHEVDTSTHWYQKEAEVVKGGDGEYIPNLRQVDIIISCDEMCVFLLRCICAHSIQSSSPSAPVVVLRDAVLDEGHLKVR